MSHGRRVLQRHRPLAARLRRRGRCIVEGPPEGDDPGLPGVKFDYRTREFRAEAIWYRTIVEHLRRQKIPYTDEARDYEPVPWKIRVAKEAFPHQTEGLQGLVGRPGAAGWSCCRPGPARRTWPTSRSRRPAGRRWSSRRRST